MLTATGNARFRNLLPRFGSVVEFPLQYFQIQLIKIVIIKSITHLFFKRCFHVRIKGFFEHILHALEVFTVMMRSVLFK